MSETVRLEQLIEKSHIKCRDFDGGRDLEAFGVSNTDGITRTAHRKSDDLGDYLVIQPGSFAYNPYRINVGSIGLTPEGLTGLVSPAYIVFRAKKTLIPEVLLDFLKSAEGLRQINKLASGAVRKALRFEDLCEIEFPALSHSRQLEILKHKKGFNQQYELLLKEISYQEAQLAKLKQAILQEAIKGKLTAEWRAANPNVEPASQLLHRITTQRVADYKKALDAAVKIGQRKPKKPRGLIPPLTYEVPDWPDIPPTWVATVIDKVGMVCVGSTPDRNRKEYWGGSIPWVSSGEVANCFIYDTHEKITDEGFNRASVTMHPPGTVLIAMIGQGKTRGQSAVLKIAACTNQNSASVLIDHGLVVPEFLWMVFLARYQESRGAAKGGNQPALNGEVIGRIALRLPPLAEQAVIVERVETLMATCRGLEVEIEHTRAHAAHLLQAVLKEAFFPVSSNRLS